eukprot:1147155-Pelagomonas_calceolata.AAC.9
MYLCTYPVQVYTRFSYTHARTDAHAHPCALTHTYTHTHAHTTHIQDATCFETDPVQWSVNPVQVVEHQENLWWVVCLCFFDATRCASENCSMKSAASTELYGAGQEVEVDIKYAYRSLN